MTSLELNSWGQVAQPLPPHFWLMVIESVSEHELSFLLRTTVLPIDFSWPSWLDGQLRECILHPPNPIHYPGPLDRPELNCREPDSFNLLVSLGFKAVPIELRRTLTQHSTRLVYSTSLQLPRRNKLAHWSTGLKLEPGPQNKLIHFWASWLQHIYNFTSLEQCILWMSLEPGLLSDLQRMASLLVLLSARLTSDNYMTGLCKVQELLKGWWILWNFLPFWSD